MLTFPDLPAHVRLMLLAARASQNHEERKEIEELSFILTGKGTNSWQDFLALSMHHRVAPLVFDSLDRIRPVGLPDAVLERLRQLARDNAFRAARCAKELRRIARPFASAGIPLTVLKGLPLSDLLFHSPNARHVGDIDLLSTADRLPEQIEILAELGYVRVNPVARLTRKRLASYTRFWKDLTFTNEEEGFELDLHWRLFNNRFHPANRLLDQATYSTSTVFGTSVRVFSPEDQFLHVAAHGISDAWTYLKSLADVAGFLKVLSADELDGALRRAGELGFLDHVSAAVHLSNDWMGTGVSSSRLASPGSVLARRVRQRTESMLMRHGFKPPRSQGNPAEWLLLEQTLVPDSRSLLELARRLAWRPRIWASVDLPDKLFWLYPLVGLAFLPRVDSTND